MSVTARLAIQAIALAAPAGLFAWWMRAHTPVEIGAFSIGAVPALVVLTGALVLVARRRRARARGEPIAAVGLFVVGVVLTGGFWFRVWSYRDWDMGGILVGATNIVGFWWPAVAVALGMWVLEEVALAPGGWPRLRARLGVGLLAGAVGAGGYHYGDSIYYARVDREPLDRAVGTVANDLAFLVSGGLPFRLERGHLHIVAETGPPVTDRPYVVFRTLERGLARARELPGRKDVDRVTLVLRAGGGELVRFEAREADRARPVWELARVDRTRLKNGGRVEEDSLDAMLTGWTPDNRALFVRWFTAVAAGDELRVAFRPDVPLSPATIELQSAAWASANNVIREAVRYFPEIARVRVALPRLTTVVERGEVGADFQLQHRLVPAGRVLGLVLREPGGGDAAVEPANFQPLFPVPGFQLALVHVTPHLTEHAAGVLFERLEQFGWLLDAAADGTATVILDDGRGVRAGPVSVRPGETVEVQGRRLQNAGWLARTAFRRTARD